MSIDIDYDVSVRCDDCRKRCGESETINHCHSCEEKRKTAAEPAQAGDIRDWADRKLLLGQITREQADFLAYVAKDIELSKTPLVVAKKAA